MCNRYSCQRQSSSKNTTRPGAPSRGGDVYATFFAWSMPILLQIQTFKKDTIKETNKTKNKQTKAEENKVELWQYFPKMSPS